VRVEIDQVDRSSDSFTHVHSVVGLTRPPLKMDDTTPTPRSPLKPARSAETANAQTEVTPMAVTFCTVTA
jgi:hypothetical protein